MTPTPDKEKEKKPKYWIASYTIICPLCGSENTCKNREYSKRPNDWNERNEIVETYDYCNE